MRALIDEWRERETENGNAKCTQLRRENYRRESRGRYRYDSKQRVILSRYLCNYWEIAEYKSSMRENNGFPLYSLEFMH